tara:strand:- start:135 stop:779 length:645 start_codon:yes stop_codon:yes gene_type:complete
VNIILFGPPGSGKGTQADNLVRDYNLYKISTGDLLREEVKKESSLGNEIKKFIDKGIFVTDEIIKNLIENIISNKKYFNNIIFDGYPRNLNQAKNLSILIKKYNQKIARVFSFKVDQNVVLKRLSGRQVCSKCGLIFNEFFNPSTENNHKCDSKFLQKRSDDNDKTVKIRFDIYNKETLPVLDFYKNQNLLSEIDGMKQINAIYGEIREIIHSL